MSKLVPLPLSFFSFISLLFLFLLLHLHLLPPSLASPINPSPTSSSPELSPTSTDLPTPSALLFSSSVATISPPKDITKNNNYTVQDFHEMVESLSTDIRTMFTKAERDNAHFSAAVAALEVRVQQLEQSLCPSASSSCSPSPLSSSSSVLSLPCLLLTILTLLLLAIALLVLCNTLMVRKLAKNREGNEADGGAKRAAKVKGEKEKGKERELVVMVNSARREEGQQQKEEMAQLVGTKE